MARRRKPAPPSRPARPGGEPGLPSLDVLEEFSRASLSQWLAAGKNLERFSQALFFELEKHRALHSSEFMDALRASASGPLEFSNWSRLVDYRFASDPLSMEGSLKGDGGRFNIGRTLNPATYTPFPALYVAEDFSAAFRERFGIDKQGRINGLTADELALRKEDSFASVALNIRVESVLNVGDLDALRSTAAILSSFQIPKSVSALARSLRLKPPGLVRTAPGLQRQLLSPIWRLEPAQYDLPSNSQIFGRLCSAAGIHAILYPSVRDGTKRCLALLPQNWSGSTSFVELLGPVPDSVLVRRLDGS